MPGIDAALVASALKKLPNDAEMVWLNDYSYGARADLGGRLRTKLAQLTGADIRSGKVSFGARPDVLTTAEAYAITPAYARRLISEIENNIGAIDRHMQLVNSRPRSKVYQTEPPLFGQADRSDSDTGGH